jgi:hypothetical protein
MMELERLKAFKEMEIKADHRKEVIYHGSTKIID